MPILVTGAAGFIGYHLALRLLERGESVVGLDNLNHYYDVSLKEARLRRLAEHAGFQFVRSELADKVAMEDVFAALRPKVVVNLGAQAGVRHSIDAPHDYLSSNVTGFLNVLEGCRRWGCEHLIFASSSSVYGANARMPYSAHDGADHPLSLYAATKRSNELMAHSYAHLFGIPVTGLRFFTVYGPWGRPDMAYFLFVDAILHGRSIDVYNGGEMERDFTYIDDAVEGIVRLMARPPKADAKWAPMAPDPSVSAAPFRIYNIGNSRPTKLVDFIKAIEDALGQKATVNIRPLQPGDVVATWADVEDLRTDTGYAPSTPLVDGVHRFVQWFRSYYNM